MLAEEEPDDDTHLCIKCNTTIIGLENYIEHRKSFCPTTKLINKPRTTDPTTTTTAAAAESTRVTTTTVSGRTASSGPVVAIKKVSGEAASSSAPTGINNKDQSKLKASYDRDDDRKSHSAHGFAMKLADTSFGEDDEHNYDSSKSNKALDKSLDSFHLDYDLMGHRSSAGDSSRARVADKLPSEDVDYNYEGADIFFSSLQLQSSSKRNLDRKSFSNPLTVDTSHRQGEKLMSTGTVVSGKTASSPLYHQHNLDPHLTDSTEDSDVGVDFDFPPYQGYDVDDSDDFEDQFSVPPRTHTGGKWKPEHRPNSNAMRTSSPKYRTTSESYEHPSWTVKHSAHPTTAALQQRQSVEDEEYMTSMSPPQNYTRGKWVPGSKVIKGTTVSLPIVTISTSISRPTSTATSSRLSGGDHMAEKSIDKASGGGGEWLWCSVCNRKLASLVIFQRHLQSNLHLKRVLLEKELEEPSTSKVATRHSLLEGSGEAAEKKTLLTKRQLRRPNHPSSQPQLYSMKVAAVPSRHSCDSLISQQPAIRTTPPATLAKIDKIDNRVEEQETVDDDGGRVEFGVAGRTDLISAKHTTLRIRTRKTSKKKTRKIRKKIYTTCDVCKIKLPISYLGKHLISLCHYRRMQLNRSEASRSMVLQNLELICRQSPFQCQPCRYYTITEDLFMMHWMSEGHRYKMETSKVQFMWCSFCKFDCTTKEMETHLRGQGHQEVVQAFNRSVPIVIRERIALDCPACKKEFRLNIALRKHNCESGGGISQASTASDSYQCIYSCSSCPSQFRSCYGLKIHLRLKHGEQKFFCSACKLTFTTKENATRHRNTLEHKVASGGNWGDKGQRRTCKSCNEEFADILKLKQHLRDKHPDQRFSCLLCGEQFVVAQELTSHVRNKKCGSGRDTPIKQLGDNDNPLSCPLCDYRTASEAELIFHRTVRHGEISWDTGRVKIPCPTCDKPFSKASLLCHLRKHTNERIFQCPQCDKGYTRKYNLVDHMKNCRAGGGAGEDGAAVTMEEKDSTESPLTRLLKCSFPECSYQTNANRNLIKHKEIHLTKDFQCPQCPYKTTTARYLKRHTVMHGKN